MSLSIRDVEYVLAIASAGQISAAAASLGVTQPALSKAVQRVEETLGVSIFERAARGVVLTSTGLRVLEQLQALQSAYTDTVHLVDELRANSAGLLRVGVTDNSAKNQIVPALSSLIAQRPGLRVKLSIDRSDGLAAQVARGDLDLALVPIYEGQVVEAKQTKILIDVMVPLVRASHPLAGRPSLSVRDLLPFGWLMSAPHSAAHTALTAALAREGFSPPNVVMEVPYSSELNLAILSQTDLVTMAPRSVLSSSGGTGFVELGIPALRMPRTVVLLSRLEGFWSPLMEAIRERLMARHVT
ncbi:LysR family transcriptional regulator [Ottowia caeni]|uniref:LysR family transcriptional regulator n=1 Tax=Ottowia caeni TaxID=2870339 RepID=UPI001E36EA3E|nr:LysR family transcriptional regulator [Ottowia caeni]